MKKTITSTAYTLIPEWDKHSSIAIVSPAGLKKYKLDKTEESYPHIIEDIINCHHLVVSDLLTAAYEDSMDLYLMSSLDKLPVNLNTEADKIRLLNITDEADIWIRDWAPLPALDAEGNKVYIKAVYRPSYLTIKESAPSDKAGRMLAETLNIPLIEFPLVWDIGNFSHNGIGTGIVTRLILKDNPRYSAKDIKSLFREVMSIDNLIIIDEEPDDPTGHLDSNVRFLSENLIAVSEYPRVLKQENDYIKRVMHTINKEMKTIIEFVRIPNGVLFDREVDGINSLFGSHMNFLRSGEDVLVCPVYGIPSDYDAMKSFERVLPGCTIFPCFEVTYSHLGGSLNCITWTG